MTRQQQILRQRGKAASLGICAAAYAVAAVVAVAVGRLVSPLPPAQIAFLADIAATIAVFAFSLGFDNSSVYDPYWSVAPVAIALYWLASPPRIIGARQIVAFLLVAAWSIRLTANWIGRWQGLTDEDWRYAERRSIGPAYWPLSFVGFHLMPTVVVFLGCLPLLPVLSRSTTPSLHVTDGAGFAVAVAAIVLEAAADGQLRRFLASRREPGAILDSGVWALCRHPNYLGEVLFWWGLWLLSLSADPGRWWTVIGPLAITGLFLGVSIPMMDRHMKARHPGYAAYRTSIRKRKTPAEAGAGRDA